MSEQPTAIVARVKVTGDDYGTLLSLAREHFFKFFEGEYVIVGAEIQPDQVAEGFGGDEIISWQGMFYATPPPERYDWVPVD